MPHTVSLEAWQEFLAAHAAGGVLDGRVSKVLPFGAIVELAGGVAGLLRDSAEVQPGARVAVTIDSVDLERRRVSLSPA